jgi:hypothetical protein
VYADQNRKPNPVEKNGPSGNFVGLLEFSAKENLYARQRTLPAYSWVELTVVGAGCGTGC